ncbi:LysR substrate-binding domain-containing protein [Microbulbifer taiwanensis]
MRFDYAYQAIEAARLGMGLALADRLEVNEDLAEGRLVTVIERPFTIGQSLYLACARGPQLNARSRLVIGLVLEWLRSRGAPLEAAARQLQLEFAASAGEGRQGIT